MKRSNFAALLLVVSVHCIFGGAADVEDQAVQESSGDELHDSPVSWGFENSFASDNGGGAIDCGAALLQGRRLRQEDRILCLSNIVLPPHGGLVDVRVSMYAVFDGHTGDEASQLASQILHKRFLHHLYRRVTPPPPTTHSSHMLGLPSVGGKGNSIHQKNSDVKLGHRQDTPMHESNVAMENSTSNANMTRASGDMFLHSALGVILKEALDDAIADIELRFSVEANERGLHAGSTACVVLQVGDHLLVASLGDSKAILCPVAACSSPPDTSSDLLETRRKEALKRRLNRMDSKAPIAGTCADGQSILELTRDHHPDREDEKRRVEGAGGFVSDYGGIPRVNGELAVSRSIGDHAFKKFGVSAEPEWTGWLKIGSNASHLVVATDGVFERLTTLEVCNVVSAVMSGTDVSIALGLPVGIDPPIALPPRKEESKEKQKSRAIVPVPQGEFGFASENSDADFAKAIVDVAFSSGSRDNLAAIVVPLRIGTTQGHDLKSDETHSKGHAADKMSEVVRTSSPILIDVTGSLVDGEFGRGKSLLISGMLVKGLGGGDCYELIDTVVGSSILPLRPVIEYSSTENFNEAFKLVDRLPASAHHGGIPGGQLEIYREHLICTPEATVEGNVKEMCLPPEGLSRFLNIFGSIPLDKQQLMPKYWDTEGRSRDSELVPPYSVNHHRYMLQKNFARGAFGEVWLAAKRPCMKQEIREFSPVHNAFQETNLSEPQDTGHIPGGKFSKKQPNYNGWASGHFRHEDTFILKRIMVEKGSHAYLSGLREKHFGETILNATQAIKNSNDQSFSAPGAGTNHKDAYWKPSSWNPKKVLEFFSAGNVSSQTEDTDSGLDHIARYVESFEWPGEELWLVFHCEGKSLSSLMYTVSPGVDAEDDRDSRSFKVVQPSSWWRWLKTTEAGKMEMRSILHQLLLAVKACHDRNITHRDIKPENMVVSGGRGSEWPSNLTVRLIDFGSAIDKYSLDHLYGSSGPSQAEQTAEYAPPEASLSQHWLYFHPGQTHVYDMWSVGIVVLELVLGTPHVFQISARTRILLEQQLEGMDEAAKKTIFLLRAYLEMCILVPRIPPQHHHHYQPGSGEQSEEVRLAAWKCTEESVMQQIKQRDPLGIGMPDVWAFRLLRELLQWYPVDRISVEEALKHPYFHPSHQR